MNNKFITIIFCLLFAGSLSFIAGCSKDAPKQALKSLIVPVTTAAVTNEDVPVQISGIGTVEAYSTISITARVGGELLNAAFNEGEYVKQGDLLFTIDPRPYQAALEAAKANLMKNTALAKNAEDDLVRYSELFNEDLVSRNDYERAKANADAAKAMAEADKAAVENASLQLGYCSVYAPISGRTGSLLVNKGNLIKANDNNPMVVINQVQPVYVSFSVPEHNLSEIRRYMAAGKLNAQASLSKEDNRYVKGLLSFVDNTVDTSTGMIRLKAVFENREEVLWPGQFVNVTIALSAIQDAVVIPSQAVQTGQQGQFVFVIKEDTAELRLVSTGISYEDITIVESGLEPGEQVVTDGQMLLMPGAKVEIKNNT